MIVGGRRSELSPKTKEWAKAVAEHYRVSQELVEDAYRYASKSHHSHIKKRACIEFIEKKVLGW